MSCCTCGNNCQSGCGCRVIVLPDNPVSLYSAANINTQGIGVYDSTEGTEFDFRGIYSATIALTVALDAGNNAIVLTLDIPSIIDDLPQATTSQIGVGETATDAEAIAKASITTFLTPSNLAAIPASSIFAGLVELATDAETQAGVSATLAVTPAGLASLTATQNFTVTFVDAVARAAATPAFIGQFGAQQDTAIAYLGASVLAGNWRSLLTFSTSNPSVADATQITLTAGSVFTFLPQDANTIFLFDGNGQLQLATVTDFTATCRIYDAGVIVPASSVLTTSATAGQLNSRLLTTFVSTANTNTGWTAFTNSAVLKTGDCNALTLPQLCQIVDTLIGTLRGVLLPAL